MENKKLVCHNSQTKVYDIGDSWLAESKGRTENLSKKTDLFYPLACVAKWGFVIDDEAILKKLSETT